MLVIIGLTAYAKAKPSEVLSARLEQIDCSTETIRTYQLYYESR
jgi:hypothetical protein